ncbi:MAG: hypothetical protein JOZ62_00100, partial [Acidobacteriaceae bacterium]|nr:hypothetical protein [Acidobacteriaceae bacterium]
MPQANDPELGINSWLEDELYHQYQFDRKSVDESWIPMFQEAGGNGAQGVGNGSASEAASNRPGTPAAVAEPPITRVREPEPPRQEPPQQAPPREEPPQPAPAPQERVVHSATTPGPVAQPGAAEVARSVRAATAKQEVKTVGVSDQLIPLRGAAARIAENMTASLSIPVATSQRQIPVRVIEENRNLINKYRAQQGKGKLSFTH